MNFYDVYTTLSLNPETQQTLDKIAEFLECPNQLEPMKQALFKKPNRSQFSGAFPFDEETGKIYDTLWKAADAENYSTVGKVGRWLMKLICPPADDEGMAAYHKKASHEPEISNSPPHHTNSSPSTPDYPEHQETHYQTNEIQQDQPQETWEDDNNDEEVIIIPSVPKPKQSDIIKRSNKKGD